jgi:hypothetical protein
MNLVKNCVQMVRAITAGILLTSLAAWGQTSYPPDQPCSQT